MIENMVAGTESSRRRQPFQGCLPPMLSGSESVEANGSKEITLHRI